MFPANFFCVATTAVILKADFDTTTLTDAVKGLTYRIRRELVGSYGHADTDRMESSQALLICTTESATL